MVERPARLHQEEEQELDLMIARGQQPVVFAGHVSAGAHAASNDRGRCCTGDQSSLYSMRRRAKSDGSWEISSQWHINPLFYMACESYLLPQDVFAVRP